MNNCIYCNNKTKGKVCSLKSCKNKYKQKHYHDNIERYRFIKSEERKRNFPARKDKALKRSKEKYYRDDLDTVTSLMFQNIRARAKQYEMSFNLDKEFLTNLFHTQDNRCALTGISFEYTISNHGYRHGRPFAPSLDRIDCKNGYTKDNVRLVCIIVNFALCEFGDVAFDKMCKAYINATENNHG